jgi:D-lyxose ketol-isomerase
MKRSEINAILSEGQQFIRKMGFYLPPFAHWTANQWSQQGEGAREIVENSLGWDVTDFGSGDYFRTGLLLFTVRNGSAKEMRAKLGKLYCEKVMIAGVGQLTPMHFHRSKVEDIINRGGGNLTVKLYNSTEHSELATSDVMVTLDGIERTVKAGSELVLTPGESVTIRPGLYHSFWGEGDTVLVGEVSLVNDDVSDNFFLTPVGRFPRIEDDELPLHLLVSDYPQHYQIDRK